MRFLDYFTSFGVPHVLHYGPASESRAGLGPFTVVEHISNEADFVDPLNTPGLARSDRPILDPKVDRGKLEDVYGQMADVLLQLSKPTFSQIGCIDRVNPVDYFDDTWAVKHRPLTFNINELVQLGGVSPSQLLQHPFKTASAYYETLAETHIVHLASQRNDVIESSEDCRRKYIARCLFRKITREYKLCEDEEGPFRLFCDDLRPANFTYAAPSAFAYSPPFWLLLELPGYWEEGPDDWVEKYEEVLPVFLKVLKEKEDAGIERGVLSETDRLSGHMLKSWQTGDFWLNYAARKSWAFDMIYWANIDERFFGEGSLDDRIRLLSEEEREAMDGFVEMKLKAREEGELADWTDVKDALPEAQEVGE
ncbi:uncharacterized protein BDV14DRAFT_210959 [Aspergillus stella-maris]|uniref:uncharacterized protein n=1 Tax=Aspergillus stella-maris TaxID=1810926 RepID=UPI003CCDA74B